MIRHTPGPWTVHSENTSSLWPYEIRAAYERREPDRPGLIFRERYSSVLGAAIAVDGGQVGEGLANATLWAAAPDLLAALEGLGTMPDGYCFCPEDPDPRKAEHTGECAAARAVLLKAGREVEDA